MKVWSNLSLKMKSALALGFLMLVTAGTFAFVIYETKLVNSEYSHILDEELKMRDKLNQLTIEMLMARRHEKDFLSRKDEKYIERNSKSVADMKALIELINISTGYDFKEGELETLKKSIEIYSNGFAGAVNAVVAEGDSSKGFVSEAVGLAREIEGVIKSEKLGDTAYKHLLMLRRHEKDYLLRRDPKYLNEIKIWNTY